MPKPRKKELVQCRYFQWRLGQRDGTFYADGRSNSIVLGRYSLSTTTRDEALENLQRLDLVQAVEHGLAEAATLSATPHAGISLADGRDLYLDGIRGARITQGGSAKTAKRYKPVFDKFLPFAAGLGVTTCLQVTKGALRSYAAYLDGEGYAYATEYLELTTLKQFVKFLITEGKLPESSRIVMPLKKPEDTDTYCWRPEEVAAILKRCQEHKDLIWLGQVLTTLTFTGMRISELASLRWSDLEFEKNMIRLTDERHSAVRKKRGDARELKGKRSRSFPIHLDLRPLLQSIPRSPDGKVFHGPLDGKLKPDLVRRCLIRDVLTPLAAEFPTPMGEATGFVDGRVHSFRHYFCSMCANASVPEQALMKWLGHRSSRMVKRYYHLHDAESQRAMQGVNFVPSEPRE
jgi:integrase